MCNALLGMMVKACGTHAKGLVRVAFKYNKNLPSLIGAKGHVGSPVCIRMVTNLRKLVNTPIRI